MVARLPRFFAWRAFIRDMGDMASKTQLPSKETALPGRAAPLRVSEKHHVSGNRTTPPFPEGTQMALFGKTGHAEVVRVVFDPAEVTYENLLRVFWENHDPTQGMRQGNDVGTTYRSAIYAYSAEQMRRARSSRDEYQKALTESGYGKITTEIREAPDFYYAEDYHQQYLSKNPTGYCGSGGTGVTCPTGLRK
ncbi:mitochondrial peptide methionine sulfoxide reductase isoform X4 [Scleropages formosus]|uniref:mitochondrial peptide methionine sulfoxide reductase isoform X4 n=1 Tax=Scleropages formosus TaxID=113540 RepID=UPI000878776B|nr:mitochondrial peptide methionine sulfoxide reductase isoform X4 [Scleropages formosus]